MQISFFFNMKLRFVLKLIIYISVLISLEFPFEHLIFYLYDKFVFELAMR